MGLIFKNNVIISTHEAGGTATIAGGTTTVVGSGVDGGLHNSKIREAEKLVKQSEVNIQYKNFKLISSL